MTPIHVFAQDGVSSYAGIGYGVILFSTGLLLGYLFRSLIWRSKHPEEYWANRFLSRGDRKSATRLVELRPDSLDLMGVVFRSGFEDEVDAAYQALMNLRASDVFCNSFGLDVEIERSARAMLELKHSDIHCLEKIFMHKKLSAELVEEAARRLFELGAKQLMNDLLDSDPQEDFRCQRDIAARLLLSFGSDDPDLHKKLFVGGYDDDTVLKGLLNAGRPEPFVQALRKGVAVPLAAGAIIYLDQGGTRKIGQKTVVEMLINQCTWEDQKGSHTLREIILGTQRKGDLIFIVQDIDIYSRYDEIMKALGKRDKSGVIKQVEERIRTVLASEKKKRVAGKTSEEMLRNLVNQ